MEHNAKSGRRAFLRNSSVAAAGAALGLQAARAGEQAVTVARARGAPVADGAQFDVIVIGAGFAGLTAARDSAQRGAKTLLIEARNRIGGRTFTAEYAGAKLELGGTWIHWSQPFVWSEISRYGLEIEESPGFGAERMSWIAQGQLRHGKAGDVLRMMGEGLETFCNIDGQGGRTVFPRAHDPFFSRLVAKYDGLSMQDRLDQMEASADQRALAGAFVGLDCHNDPAVAGVVDQLKWWALGDFDASRMADKLGRFKFAQGTSALANAMLGEADVDLLLSTPVRAVRSEGQLTTVTAADGKRYLGKAVICTVPMNVLKTIAFTPPLSPAKRQASIEEHTGKGSKFYIHVRQKVGAWMGLAPYPNPMTAAWAERDLPDGTLLVAFAPPGKVEMNDHASVQRALRTLLPGVEVVAVTGYHWTEDPYSLGTWCMYRPGQFTRYLHALGEREGNIFFASADSANGWRGFIDGAIEGGSRAAREVSRYLHGA